MILTFRPIKVWPEGWRERRGRPTTPFKASYQQTLQLLDRELHHLGATAATLQVDASERDCRLDGQLRADARPGHPGVILTVETRKHGSLVYATDRFDGWYGTPGWQANLRAIALGLEALRRVERYGIAERGQQYAGYRELGAGLPMGPATMTIEQAARLIRQHAVEEGSDPETWYAEVEADPSFALALFKDAAKLHHPDAGGDAEVFKRLVEARDLLARAFPQQV